jgi:hypothetical protein
MFLHAFCSRCEYPLGEKMELGGIGLVLKKWEVDFNPFKESTSIQKFWAIF